MKFLSPIVLHLALYDADELTFPSFFVQVIMVAIRSIVTIVPKTRNELRLLTVRTLWLLSSLCRQAPCPSFPT